MSRTTALSGMQSNAREINAAIGLLAKLIRLLVCWDKKTKQNIRQFIQTVTQGW